MDDAANTGTDTATEDVAPKKKRVAKKEIGLPAPGVIKAEPDTIIVGGQSSTTMKRDSKGKQTWEIKVYDKDPEKAAEKAADINDKLAKRYPNT